MSRTTSRSVRSQVPVEGKPLLKVNEILNSIYAMRSLDLDIQLTQCAKIVGELLQNDFISHLTSLKAAKLLAYELILFVAEEAAVEKPRLTLMENTFGQNKKVRLTASLRHNLTAIEEILEETLWQANGSKRRGGTEKKIGTDSKLSENIEEFRYLLKEFDRLQGTQEDQDGEVSHKERETRLAAQKLNQLKRKDKDRAEELEENEALIEQLEEIVSKKEKRIKELSEELEESILDQKQLEDLMDQVQNRNFALKEEVKILNQKLAQSDGKEIELQELIGELQARLLLQQKEGKKSALRSENTLKTRFTMEDLEDDRKQFKDFLEAKSCEECLRRKQKEHDELEGFMRMLYTQALSIEALI